MRLRPLPVRAGLAGGLLAAVLALGCGERSDGTAAATPSLQIRVSPVEIAPAEMNGLRLLSAAELSADHPEFGGFSGLLVESGRLLAVTDQGWLLSAQLDTVGGRILIAGAAFAPLPGESGAGTKSSSDAESLARQDGRLAIGFEQDHRIEFWDSGRTMDVVRDRRFERLASNNGLEALATLPDGSLIAIAEEPLGDAFPVFVIRTNGAVEAGALPRVGRHLVTGADFGPDGWLYILRRDWSIFTGLSARIERYRTGPDGYPRAETRDVLAAFEGDSGIDNMEGIAIWHGPRGTLHLAIISDDNFGFLQRTLMMIFEVLR